MTTLIQISFFLEVSSDNGSQFTDTLNYIIAESSGKWVGAKKGKNYVVNTSQGLCENGSHRELPLCNQTRHARGETQRSK